jgi:hypothetical protein
LRDQLNALNYQIPTVSDLSSDVVPQMTAADLEAIHTKLNAIISALTV